jgi:hypothetical protein
MELGPRPGDRLARAPASRRVDDPPGEELPARSERAPALEPGPPEGPRRGRRADRPGRLPAGQLPRPRRALSRGRRRRRSGDRGQLRAPLAGRLVDGSALAAAERYVAAGAETIFIRIRRFDPRRIEHVLAYLELVERIDALGARAVADSVGHFGVVAVADGAFAFSAGARFFRKVPDALLQRPSEPSEEDEEEDKDGGGGPPILYEHPGELAGVHRDEAGPHLRSCPEPGCLAEGGKGKARHLRAHNFHEFRRQARLAAVQGLDFAATLRAIGSEQATIWAEALEQRAVRRRASEATRRSASRGLN